MAAKYIRLPFAVTGTRTVVPDDAQPSGAVSWDKGWTVDYQLDPDTEPTAKLIDRAQTNETLYQLSLAIQQYQQYGVPDFITTEDNAGTPFPYSQFARVRYAGAVYESLVDNNTALPTDATKWAQVSVSTESGVPVGAMMAYGGALAPDGWLLCYGQELNRTTFAPLFAAIGTRYGAGDGINTFNVPDKRGRVSVGRDNMGGADDGTGPAANRITNAVAGFVGTQIGAAGGNQNVQSHSHTATVTDPGHTHTTNIPTTTGQVTGGGGNPTAYGPIVPYTSSSNTTGISVSNSTFGSGSSGNVQPSQVDTWIIKT